MQIAVFGASGGTGRQIVAQALAAGHAVKALVRDAAALPAQPRLAVLRGSASERDCVEAAVVGSDAVLCALGGHPLRRRERVCSTAMRTIVPAMQRHGVRRIVAVSTFGAGDSRHSVGWLARTVLFGAVLRSEVADKEAMEEQLAASALDWTVVRIGRLTDEPGTGRWRAADDGSIVGMATIARADVAAFMLAALADGEWIRRRPVLVS
jgi:putative NADH-flavin reductase